MVHVYCISRLLLVQEKEQLLRELRGIDMKGRSEVDIEKINEQIRQLGVDLNHAKEVSNKQIAERQVETVLVPKSKRKNSHSLKFCSALSQTSPGFYVSALQVF